MANEIDEGNEAKAKLYTHSAFIKIATHTDAQVKAIRNLYASQEFRDMMIKAAPGCCFMYADSDKLSVADKELIACALGEHRVYDVGEVARRFANTAHSSRRGSDSHHSTSVTPVTPPPVTQNVQVVAQK